MIPSIIIMGVAGCGKSSLGLAVARASGFRLLEGDDYHSPQSKAKMSQGVALLDADRDGWLSLLADELRSHAGGLVLTCSALKKSYRDWLRQASPGLRFVYLDISREEAQLRVEARAAQHFFSTSLVDSQFATLESPLGEPGVLGVDARAPLEQLQAQVSAWMTNKETA